MASAQHSTIPRGPDFSQILDLMPRVPILLASVFSLALVCRLVGQVVLGAYHGPTTWEYETIASNILAGHGYTYQILGQTYVASQSSPLYIYLAVVVYALTAHSQAALLVVQALLGAGSAVLCAWLAARLFSLPAAWLSGILVATHPAQIVYAAELHALTLDVFLICAVVAAFVAIPMRPGAVRLGLLGALIGLAALTRTTVLALAPIGLLWLRHYRSAAAAVGRRGGPVVRGDDRVCALVDSRLGAARSAGGALLRVARMVLAGQQPERDRLELDRRRADHARSGRPGVPGPHPGCRRGAADDALPRCRLRLLACRTGAGGAAVLRQAARLLVGVAVDWHVLPRRLGSHLQRVLPGDRGLLAARAGRRLPQ